MKTTIVVDGNWLFNRAAFAAAGRPEAIAWNVVSMACADALFAKADSMLVGFDGHKVFRYELWPLYKISRKGVKLTKEQLKEAQANRKLAQSIASQHPGHRDIYQYLPLLQQYLTKLGIPWIHPPQFEADDVLASAAFQLDGRIVLDAPDKDLYQCLTKSNVRVLSTKHVKGTMRREYITKDKVIEKYGVTPEQMIDYQTLVGDSIDYIQSVIGPKTAAKLLAEHGSLKAILKADPKLRKHKDQLVLNRQLVTLSTDVHLPRIELGDRTDVKAPKAYKEWRASLLRGSLF